MPDWEDLIPDARAERENLPVPADEVLYPALVKLSLRRRLEILEAIEIPAVIEARHIPLIKIVKEVAADITRDAIKIGEAQIRQHESRLDDIRAAIAAYHAREAGASGSP